MIIFWPKPTGGNTTNPGQSNVAFGVTYFINGTMYIGTLIKNTLASATLIGQKSKATLIQG